MAINNITLLWGQYEKTQGIIDFIKEPKNRIERELQNLEQNSQKTNIVFSFAPNKNIFPSHLFLNPEYLEIPTCAIDENHFGLKLEKIPNCYSEYFIKNFKNFMGEATQILDLYKKPGPIENIFIDWGLYRYNTQLLQYPSFVVQALTKRYQNIKNLNQVYQTNFVSFEAISQLKAFNVLFEKRPWMAAFDYQYSVHYSLKNLIPEFATPPSKTWAHKASLIWDPIFCHFEPSKKLVVPLIIENKLFTELENYFRALKDVQNRCHFYQIQFTPAFAESEFVCIASTKYMSKQFSLSIIDLLEKNVPVYFWGDTPQFDEHLNSYGLLFKEIKKVTNLEEFYKIQKSNSLSVPMPG
jgi:hypothetical protein